MSLCLTGVSSNCSVVTHNQKNSKALRASHEQRVLFGVGTTFQGLGIVNFYQSETKRTVESETKRNELKCRTLGSRHIFVETMLPMQARWYENPTENSVPRSIVGRRVNMKIGNTIKSQG